MALTKQEVEHIAKLARLGISAEEKEKFTTQLSSILEYFEQLKEVDTEGVEPTAQVTGLENVYVQDTVNQIGKEVRDKLLKQAPVTENDLIKSKAVFE